MEVFKDFYVDGYGYLKVGNNGTIISKNGKVLNYRTDSDGYYYIRVHFINHRELMRANKKYMFQKKVHRLVGLCFVENESNYKELNHKDGIKKNNNFQNLEWCTRSYNVQHAFDHNLKIGSKGSKNGRAKLNELEVIDIRNKYKNGFKISKLSKEYQRGWSTIFNIVNYKTWKHI